MNNKTRILVVGGSGFIGTHVVSHALNLGWHVSSLSLNFKHNETESSNDLRYVAADITDSDALHEALGDASFEYVVNCGGYIDHTLFFQGGQNAIDVHFLGVLNLVKLLNRDVLKAFINIGSSDEYGDIKAPQTELQREQPISPYSLGKVATTHFLQMLYRTEQFPAITLRLFLTYGPGQDSKRFLPQIIMGCLEDRSFPTSEGKQLRDFCFIEDTVNAIYSAFKKPEARGEVMNIASGNPVTIRQVIETIKDLIGKGEPKFGEIAYRPGENMELYADNSKAKMLLDWEPKVNLNEGLNKTIQWLKKQMS